MTGDTAYLQFPVFGSVVQGCSSPAVPGEDGPHAEQPLQHAVVTPAGGKVHCGGALLVLAGDTQLCDVGLPGRGHGVQTEHSWPTRAWIREVV